MDRQGHKLGYQQEIGLSLPNYMQYSKYKISFKNMISPLEFLN